MSQIREFHYHVGVAPMMWVIFALSLVEMGAVHLFVAIKWPYVGWPLTIISALGALSILFWIRSFRRCPHLLDGERLRLRLGSLKSVIVALSDIARITGEWEPGAVKAKGSMNLAGIAYPNRCIELAAPTARGRQRIFLRLDDPAAFDAAMAQNGLDQG